MTTKRLKTYLKQMNGKEFAKNLAEKNMDKIMPVCKDHCKVEEGKNEFKERPISTKA